jgi:hypothetical protein
LNSRIDMSKYRATALLFRTSGSMLRITI